MPQCHNETGSNRSLLESPFGLRRLSAADLDGINAVIEAAVMSWEKPLRVRRLSLPSCQYGLHDFDHLTFVGATQSSGPVVGMVAWEPSLVAEAPGEGMSLAIHGLYVHPDHHGQGVGQRLFESAITAARLAELDGILVKAIRDAQGFFANQGMRALEVSDPTRDYPHRFWLDLRSAGSRQ